MKLNALSALTDVDSLTTKRRHGDLARALKSAINPSGAGHDLLRSKRLPEGQ